MSAAPGVRVVWCALCRRYVGKRHVCAAALPPPENLRAVRILVP